MTKGTYQDYEKDVERAQAAWEAVLKTVGEDGVLDAGFLYLLFNHVASSMLMTGMEYELAQKALAYANALVMAKVSALVEDAVHKLVESYSPTADATAEIDSLTDRTKAFIKDFIVSGPAAHKEPETV